jgi:hypothetical protein
MSIDIRDDSQWVPLGTSERLRRAANADGFVTIKVTTPATDGEHRRDWQWMWGHS